MKNITALLLLLFIPLFATASAPEAYTKAVQQLYADRGFEGASQMAVPLDVFMAEVNFLVAITGVPAYDSVMGYRYRELNRLTKPKNEFATTDQDIAYRLLWREWMDRWVELNTIHIQRRL